MLASQQPQPPMRLNPMNFTHYDLHVLRAGQVVTINLSGHSANIKLMDSINFNNYRNGRRHNYFGGHATTSLTNITVPSNGHWHLAIDLAGYTGTVRSSVNVSQ
jgi:hypothetical protein